nr:TIGR03617 family F420-dependent LLM class oxidoreductase [Anaerolineae bacterium]
MPIKCDAALQAIDNLIEVPSYAREAEEMGFDCLWASEVNHDPFLQLGLAATTTETIRLGTAIALSFTRSPMALAYTCWDLAAMSKGRFILGLGTQVKAHNERRFSVPWSAPVERLREVILALRHIWHAWQTGERVNYRGEHYTFTLMTPFFTPPRQPYKIPVYIAGVNTRLCQLAGEFCDGFHVHPLNSPQYLTQVVLPAIQAGAERTGRTLGNIDISASVFVITGKDESQIDGMRSFVRQQISFYASTPSYRVVFATHGWEDVAGELSRMATRKEWGAMPNLITDEMLNTFSITAPPDQIGAAVLERYRGLVNRITLYYPFAPGGFDDLWFNTLKAFEQQ